MTNKQEKHKQLQEQVDDWRNDLKKSMIGDEKIKHDVVENIIHTLSQNNISAYLYVELPNPDYPIGIPCIYQFNTVGALAKYDSNGELTEDSKYKLGFYHDAMFKAIFENITILSIQAMELGLDKLDNSDPKSFTKRMDYFNYFIYSCIKGYQDKSKEIIDEYK
jgi:hypothetical protein